MNIQYPSLHDMLDMTCTQLDAIQEIAMEAEEDESLTQHQRDCAGQCLYEIDKIVDAAGWE